MRLPNGWTESSGGYLPHLQYLTHSSCGFRTEMAYGLHSFTGPFSEAAAWAVVGDHDCGEGER